MAEQDYGAAGKVAPDAQLHEVVQIGNDIMVKHSPV